MRRIEEQQEALAHYAIQNRKFEFTFDGTESNLMNELLKVLDPMEQLSRLFCLGTSSISVKYPFTKLTIQNLAQMEFENNDHIRSLKESGAPTLKSQKAAIRLIRLVSAVVSANGDYSNTNGKAIDGSKLLPFPMKRTHSYPESYDGIIHLTGCSVEIELTQNENTNNALSGLDTHGHCLQFRRSVERSVKIGYSHLVTQFMPNALTVGT
ncbi:hypothetical protein niasHT_027088 [Heterodera trifolii]|uniref:Uncharacterized protein n=1 Tax=Heterodera trifolii TaxID=157864 RepID=A0ABD2JGS4_9BILA